jgi:hypothetical protein
MDGAAEGEEGEGGERAARKRARIEGAAEATTSASFAGPLPGAAGAQVEVAHNGVRYCDFIPPPGPFGTWEDCWDAVHNPRARAASCPGALDKGFTYDGVENRMLVQKFQSRLDCVVLFHAGGDPAADPPRALRPTAATLLGDAQVRIDGCTTCR